MKMLRFVCNYTKMDLIKKWEYTVVTGVTPIDYKLKEARLTQQGHVLSLFKKAIFIRTEVILVEQIRRERGKPKLSWSVVVVKGSNYFRSLIDLTMNNQPYIYQVKGLVCCCVSLFAGRPFAVKFITVLHFQTWKAFITSKKFSKLLWRRATRIQIKILL